MKPRLRITHRIGVRPQRSQCAVELGVTPLMNQDDAAASVTEENGRDVLVGRPTRLQCFGGEIFDVERPRSSHGFIVARDCRQCLIGRPDEHQWRC